MTGNRCFNCGEELEIFRDKPYEYTECGLEGVILIGVHQSYCGSCAETYVSLPHVDQLHVAIGKILCCQKKSLLSGAEIKFLRKELQLKAKQLALVLGVTPETVSRWENDKGNISEAEDRLLRAQYMMFISEQEERVVHQNILKLFSSIPRKRKSPPKKRRLELTPADWMNIERSRFCIP